MDRAQRGWTTNVSDLAIGSGRPVILIQRQCREYLAALDIEGAFDQDIGERDHSPPELSYSKGIEASVDFANF
jgi:hypothetical protein